jgi:hypothetical protein
MARTISARCLLLCALIPFSVLGALTAKDTRDGVFTGDHWAGSSSRKQQKAAASSSTLFADTCTHHAVSHALLVSPAATFANGTTRAFPYHVPKAALNAAVPGSADAAADSYAAECCMPLAGEVAWYDGVKYSMYSSSDCHAASRVCNMPGSVAAVWLCGCPGGDCSGRGTRAAALISTLCLLQLWFNQCRDCMHAG